MFRGLRQRLIWSQVLPLILVLPMMGILLVYSLEAQVLIPHLARTLQGDSRLLAEISSAEFELWGDPILFENLISRVQMGEDIRVMFLDNQGALLYSNDPEDTPLKGTVLDLPGLPNALSGQEIALTNYSILNVNNVYVDVYEPVLDTNLRVVGIVRLSYQIGSIYDIFRQLRWQILLALGIGLALSLIIGTWLAVSISRPVKEVTDAIYGLATGLRNDPIQEKGPEELRSQVRAVNFLVQQLHSLETSRRHLLANIVHELGRPLGALRSAIHALGQGANEDPELMKDLTTGMDRETLQLQYLLDELADLYDKSLGGLELNREIVDTSEWLRSALVSWKAVANDKKIVWQEQIPPKLPSICIDPIRMTQVVGNLLSNAIKYTPFNGTITIVSGTDAEIFWLSVTDTGPGVQPEEKEKIFQPFYRGDTGRRIKQGMGLGLTIAHELVMAHGGEISLQSEPGQGSTFTVSLPLKLS